MQRFNPDFTIHLGDVYFVGDENEIRENFSGRVHHPYSPVKWHTGKLGGFALSGNPRMFARGKDITKRSCRRWGSGKERAIGEQDNGPSFFCLENKHWRVIGPGHGYNATSFEWGKMPLFEKSK